MKSPAKIVKSLHVDSQTLSAMFFGYFILLAVVAAMFFGTTNADSTTMASSKVPTEHATK